MNGIADIVIQAILQHSDVAVAGASIDTARRVDRLLTAARFQNELALTAPYLGASPFRVAFATDPTATMDFHRVPSSDAVAAFVRMPAPTARTAIVPLAGNFPPRMNVNPIIHGCVLEGEQRSCSSTPDA